MSSYLYAEVAFKIGGGGGSLFYTRKKKRSKEKKTNKKKYHRRFEARVTFLCKIKLYFVQLHLPKREKQKYHIYNLQNIFNFSVSSVQFCMFF